MVNEPEIELDVAGSDRDKETMRKVKLVEAAIQSLLGERLEINEVSNWATAVATYAGLLLGMIHQQIGTDRAFDIKAAAAFSYNVLIGIELARESVIEQDGKPN